ncbi:MAG TPA: pitrilysin family protein [Bacteroidia bacterium]|nr:pitrilysin family protein [Bacteroidia bacterium]
MISYERYVLPNGLTVILHHDASTPIVAMNILYKVGARNEVETKTGFAHLFEHLMFGGSVNIPVYDEPLQRAGGENNAFTSNDFTNYYLTLPKQNFETACWLESDRMMQLAFSEKSLDVQRHVVIEEFKQRYLNQPYGDAWLYLRPLCYTTHPYKWATIGKEISHIEDATLEDVKSFFAKYYHPANAILSVAGDIDFGYTKTLIENWFGNIKQQALEISPLPQEPKQTELRRQILERDVPASAIYFAFHCCSRYDKEFYATDLLSDILSRGKSSRLYFQLVKQKKIFATISAYMLGELDKSLFIIEGRLNDGKTFAEAEKAVDEVLQEIMDGKIDDRELQKVKQQVEASLVFNELGVANKALNLCYYDMLGDVAAVNEQAEKYNDITKQDLANIAQQIFAKDNTNILCYQPITKTN